MRRPNGAVVTGFANERQQRRVAGVRPAAHARRENARSRDKRFCSCAKLALTRDRREAQDTLRVSWNERVKRRECRCRAKAAKVPQEKTWISCYTRPTPSRKTPRVEYRRKTKIRRTTLNGASCFRSKAGFLRELMESAAGTEPRPLFPCCHRLRDAPNARSGAHLTFISRPRN